MVGRPGLNPLRYKTTYTVTSERLASLREIAEQLGLEARRIEGIEMGCRFPPDDPDVFQFLDANFKPGNAPVIETSPNTKDLEEIAGWVREARERSDLVVVSIHAHGQGRSKEELADFLRTFAHQVIDEGAAVVVGHGPHLLRGVELYRGKPIFYSLGNFVGQSELTHKLPSDSYETFRIDPTLHQGELFRERSQHDRRYWQTVVASCRWNGGALSEIAIHPVTLALDEAHHQRGWPRMAEGAEADEILDRFVALSKEFGTDVRRSESSAVVSLG